MTKSDLNDWVLSNGCITIVLPEHKANVIKIENPKTDSVYWLYLPIDNSPIKDYTVYKTCSNLGIPIPNFASYMKPLHEKIEDFHNIKRRNSY
jgi:hypothetical protein